MRWNSRRRWAVATLMVAAMTCAASACTSSADDGGRTPAGTSGNDATAAWLGAPDLHAAALSSLDQEPRRAWQVVATELDPTVIELWPEAVSDGILAVSAQTAEPPDAGPDGSTRTDVALLVGLHLGDGSQAWRHKLAPNTKTACADSPRRGALICTTTSDAGTNLWTLDLTTGKPVNTIEVPGAAGTPVPATGQDRVFVATCDPASGALGALAWDIGKQSIAWHTPLGTDCAGPDPFVQATGAMVTVEAGTQAFVLDATSGEKHPDISGPVFVAPTGELTSASAIYDPTTGKPIVANLADNPMTTGWFFIDPASQKMQLPAVVDQDLRLYARADGSILWNTAHSPSAQLEAVCNQTMLFYTPDNGDYALDMATGKRVWERAQVQIGFDGGFCSGSNFVLINPADGGLSAISTKDGSTVWILDGPEPDRDTFAAWWALDGNLIRTTKGAVSLWR